MINDYVSNIIKSNFNFTPNAQQYILIDKLADFFEKKYLLEVLKINF